MSDKTLSEMMSGLKEAVGLKFRFTYSNHRGEVADRTVVFICFWFGSTDYHLTEQFFMRANDLDRGADRDFALSDIIGPIEQVY